MRALIETLGIADTARFFQHHGVGSGDYTAERRMLNADLTMEDALALTKQHERKR